MAGTVVASTINNDTGLFATNNAYLGIAKAWVNFTGSTAAINGSFNVSSITRSATGNYQVNFTTAMPNINYAVACAGSNYVNAAGSATFFNYFSSSSTGYIAPTTSNFSFATMTYNEVAYQDPTLVTAIVIGA